MCTGHKHTHKKTKRKTISDPKMTKASHSVTIHSGVTALPKLEFQTNGSWMFHVNCKVKLVQNRYLGERKKAFCRQEVHPRALGPLPGDT